MVLQPLASKGLLRLSESGDQLPRGAARVRHCAAQGSTGAAAADRTDDRPAGPTLGVTPERGWMVAVDADEENSGVAESKLRIMEDQP
jgi:hypothetical protein